MYVTAEGTDRRLRAVRPQKPACAPEPQERVKIAAHKECTPGGLVPAQSGKPGSCMEESGPARFFHGKT